MTQAAPRRTAANFDDNAQHIAKRQYMQPSDGDVAGLFSRVADWVAGAEAPDARAHLAQRYFDLMAEKKFCPGGRVLAGAGTQHGNVLNCFVQGATEHDPSSFEGVMEVAKKLALVTKVGGGNGVNLDVYTPRAASSRPDAGVRGWAYMSVTHPDVEDFLEGLMRPPTQPDGEKQPMSIRNWTRVVYGQAIAPELVARARANGVMIVRELPEGVQAVQDDMGGIIDSARWVAEQGKLGLEPRIDLSGLRAEGTEIKGSGGSSSGPVSFLVEIFDNFLEWANLGAEQSGPINTLRYCYAPVLRVVRQGGTRRGAGMATISIDHADVLDFLTAKDLDREASEGDISTFNISILVNEAFWHTLQADGLWKLEARDIPGKYYPVRLEGQYSGSVPALEPRKEDGARAVPVYGGGIPAKWLWREIAMHAWSTGEPGLIFVDRINEYSAIQNLGEKYQIKCTNPCGEIPLSTGEPCDLGAINLAAYVHRSSFDFEAFRRDVRTCVRFLDDVLDVNVFALEDNKTASHNLRRLGLGVMGLADALILMGLRYDSEAGRDAIYEIMSALREEAVLESGRLGAERGHYPIYLEHTDQIPHEPRRNVAVLTVAPTGTTSMLMGVSSGIEPIYSPFIWRKIGSEYRALVAPLLIELLETYPADARYATPEGAWDWEKVSEGLSGNHGSVRGLDFIPEAIQQVFVCAHDIPALEHVRMQGVVQRAFDAEGYAANSLSKCIAKGTLIPTSRGLIAIEDFAQTLEDDSFTALDGSLTVDGYRITQHYRAGVKPATKITLDNGATLTAATESHRVMTSEGWKLVSSLSVGDIVLGKHIASHGPGGMRIVWNDVFYQSASRIQTPKEMSVPFARFLGMLAADGHTVEVTGNVGLTCKNEEVERQFTELCQMLFQRSPRRIVDKRNGVVVLSLTSRNLVRYVETLIGKGAYHKHAPMQLLRGSAEEKRAFLEGLTLDGYAWESGLCLYAGMSEHLAYHAAEIARSFGLPRVYCGRKTVATNGKTCYMVSVSNELQEIIQPIELHKRREPVRSFYRVFVPSSTLAATRLAVAHPGYGNFKSIRGRGAQVVKHTSAEQVGWDTDILAYRVTKVEDAGHVEMYDIEVEESHAYVVNGMISHNTINMPNEATVEDVEAAYTEAYLTGCKGITVYRDGSRQFQVLSTSKKAKKSAGADAEGRAQKAESQDSQGSSAADAPQQAERSSVESAGPSAFRLLPSAGGAATPHGEPMYHRPARLSGITDMVKLTDPATGQKRSFLVTVNSLEQTPIEVMVISGRAGDEANADSEALGRVVSIALQYGVPAEALIRTLRGINGGLYGSYNGRLVGSKADLIAVALETFNADGQKKSSNPAAGLTLETAPSVQALEPVPAALEGAGPERSTVGVGASLEGVDYSTGLACPVCESKALVKEEGCVKCMACGYSKCG